MPNFSRPVLVDTNVIIESHAQGCWIPLVGRYRLETVETCIVETQTGILSRRIERRIDEQVLRGQFHGIHHVSIAGLAKVVELGGTGLDDGEKALWAHALEREDAWILCGPDRASMKFGFNNKLRERLISLEALLTPIGDRTQLRQNYTREWLDRVLNNLALGIL